MAEEFKPKSSGWVMNHFGIKRGKLDKYDELILPGTREDQRYNQKKYRVYQKEDIEKLWYIHMLSQMGMEMKQIKELYQREDVSYREFVIQRLEELEAEKRRIEGMISIAKMCRITGRIPLPKDFATVSFTDYREKVWREWRCDRTVADRALTALADDRLEAHSREDNIGRELLILEAELGKKVYELSDDERTELNDSFPTGLLVYFEITSLERDLVQAYPQDIASKEVMDLVERYCSCFQIIFGKSNFSLCRMADYMASQLFDGDMSVEMQHKYGKEKQEYLACAFEHYANRV